MAKVIENPIINSPYAAPTRHFRFDEDGITDEVIEARRPSSYFVPVPPSRRRGGAQRELEFSDATSDRIEDNKFINRVRSRVELWRERGHPGITATTRALLEHWTAPDRATPLFFCQVEALETAIYLTEAATKNNDAWIENDLRIFNDAANPGLFRVAHKMATGTGKTVVMAMLIAWHTLNKAANPQDGRFSDAFLVVCPGITIRDRLRVLYPSDPNNYYREMDLVPTDRRGDLGRARVVVANFHQFKARERHRAPKTTKQILGQRAEQAGVFTETPDQMVRRVCRELRGKRNVVVLNDEAHHCYRRRPADPSADATDDLDALKGDEKAEAKARDEEARVWLTGLEAVNAKLGTRAIYDLSATPFFLKGSGWPEATLFQWVVSDFSLIDAIESGLVKIPRVPVDDDAEHVANQPKYRSLWAYVRDDLPKKGRKTAAVSGEPQLPALLAGALHSLYSNYEQESARWRAQTEFGSAPYGRTPPVFIVVCNNTNVSKLVFDYVAGWSKPLGDGTEVVVPGALALFSNEENGTWTARPRTVLIDSSQLESGEAMSDEFKRLASTEITEFKREYVERFPGRDAESLTDEDLLREVMNTVGKPGRLGEQVRCVVSVSMLTEGWDANTVTHILGVRAFGTQLLCEQVVGRGLRRRSYAIDPDTGHFVPEYAEVYGIPFSFIPARGAGKDPPVPKAVQRVRALPERAACAITFPRLVGYRWDLPEGALSARFDDDSRVVLSGRDVPTRTEVAGVVGEVEFHTLDDLRAVRPQQLAFAIAKDLLDRYFRDEPVDGETIGHEKPWLFPDLLRIVKDWMDDPACLVLQDHAFTQLLGLGERIRAAADKIYRGIARAEDGSARLRAILHPYDPVGSTRYADFDTTKQVWPTSEGKCHVSHVTLDSSWEQRFAQALEEIPEVRCYVKNDRLGFTVPYTLDGAQHHYVPDYVARVDDGHGPDDLLNLVVEVTGAAGEAKETKVQTMRDLWVPAVNNHGGFGRWAVLEVTDPWDAHAAIGAVLGAGVPA